MGCGDEKLSKYLTQTFTAHCDAMICQQVTLLGDAEWPKVAGAVIKASLSLKEILPHRGMKTGLPKSIADTSTVCRQGYRSSREGVRKKEGRPRAAPTTIESRLPDACRSPNSTGHRNVLALQEPGLRLVQET